MSIAKGPCERCQALPERIVSGPWAGQLHSHNYCVHCSKDLCPKCIAEGRCRENETTGKHEIESDE